MLLNIHDNLPVTLAIIMPDDVSEDKVKALTALGARVECVRPVSIVDKKQVSVHSSLLYKQLNSLSMLVCSEYYWELNDLHFQPLKL